MISAYAAPTVIATLFCLAGWGYLAYRNARDFRIIFSVACFLSALAYSFATVQYLYVFYIYRTPQHDTPMWLLFIRMLCHVSTVIIFCYRYKYSLRNVTA